MGERSFACNLRQGMRHVTWVTIVFGTQTCAILSWIFLVVRPNSILHFAPFFVLPLFPVFEPIFKKGHFCPSSPFDLPKCQTIITVRVCVEASPAESRRVLDTFRSESLLPSPLPGLRQLTFPKVKNDAGQKLVRRLHKNTACAHLRGFSRPLQ